MKIKNNSNIINHIGYYIDTIDYKLYIVVNDDEPIFFSEYLKNFRISYIISDIYICLNLM